MILNALDIFSSLVQMYVCYSFFLNVFWEVTWRYFNDWGTLYRCLGQNRDLHFFLTYALKNTKMHTSIRNRKTLLLTQLTENFLKTIDGFVIE